MKVYDDVKDLLIEWIDAVARSLLMVRERIAAPRVVRLVEQENGAFQFAGPGAIAPFQIVDGHIVGAIPPALGTILKGSRVELVLLPRRFLFRPLDLPRRAGEFLGGIVQAQIDRLTPWMPQDAAFGRTPPAEIAGDRIAVTVAAAPRAAITPYMQALTTLGARSVAVSTPLAGADAATMISIGEQAGRGGASPPRLRQALQFVMVAALALTAIVMAATAFLGNRLQQEQTEMADRINAARVALMAGHELPGGAAATQRALALRKREFPSSVITLDALTRVLPDNTYLTALRLAGDKLQISGLTRNAAALIPLIEQSAHFTHATFFAPTTQPPNDPREHFHIETRVQPVFTPGT